MSSGEANEARGEFRGFWHLFPEGEKSEIVTDAVRPSGGRRLRRTPAMNLPSRLSSCIFTLSWFGKYCECERT